MEFNLWNCYWSILHICHAIATDVWLCPCVLPFFHIEWFVDSLQLLDQPQYSTLQFHTTGRLSCTVCWGMMSFAFCNALLPWELAYTLRLMSLKLPTNINSFHSHAFESITRNFWLMEINQIQTIFGNLFLYILLLLPLIQGKFYL